MKYPSVTVLITVKNSADTMERCIESLLKLDYSRYEILVVDAYSDDGTYEILKSFGKKIRLYQKEGWAPEAYNWALDKINTDYTALIDGDNEVKKDWLKKLMSGFEPGVAEVAGSIANPKSNGLQDLLGRELEYKYSKMGKYIDKAPTMNVAFRTELVKKIKFDEKMRVGYDAEFSWEISKNGRIRYVHDAIVYHYHRATWKKFFKQQYTYAKYSPKIYMKHRSKVKGGEITKLSTILQPFVLYGMIFFAILGAFYNVLFTISTILLILLLLSYVRDSISLGKNVKEFFIYIGIFMIRTVAWAIGFIASVGV